MSVKTLMKTTLKKGIGAAKRCGKTTLFQWLAPRCGRSSAFEAKRLFSLAPSPYIAALLAALTILPDRGALGAAWQQPSSAIQSHHKMEIVNLPAVIVTPERTVDALIGAYLTDPLSTYHTNRYCTRRYYDTILKRWSKLAGQVLISQIKARTVREWHKEICGPDGTKKPMAHAMIGGLRTIVGFGVTMVEWEECATLKVILSGLRFPMAKPRSTVLTTEQVLAICQAANEEGLHSIAFEMSIQHGCTFRQKDCIGEWVPESEPGIGYAFHRGKKWVRGVIWPELDPQLILRHTTSKKNKPVIIDFKLAPLVLREIKRVPEAQILAAGPMVISEETGRPYQAQAFRKVWRMLADKVGVPKEVKNMDTRAGKITLALRLGARPIAVQAAATHSNLSTTQIYNRGGADDTAEVMTLCAQDILQKMGDAA